MTVCDSTWVCVCVCVKEMECELFRVSGLPWVPAVTSVSADKAPFARTHTHTLCTCCSLILPSRLFELVGYRIFGADIKN